CRCASACRPRWRARARSGPACRWRRASTPAPAMRRHRPSRSRPSPTRARRSRAMAHAPGQADHIEPRPPAGFVALVFGLFMGILDIQIVSASLTEIQAGLSASADEIPWVQTAYLIAEVIMIPLSGLLSRAMGTRILFSVSAGGFTLASLACGLSTSMQEMIFWRAVQGFIGGGMIPTVFATAYIVFPRSKFSVVTPVIRLLATLAPTIGPTVGGWVTEQLPCRRVFLLPLSPGGSVSTR